MSEAKITLRDIHNVSLERTLSSFDHLAEMFRLKKVFIELLKEKEDLTHYPFDLGVKENQEIIKDFVGRITEEFFEAHQVMDQIMVFVNEPMIIMTPETEDLILGLIFDYNEELADLTHFMVEILILCGVGVHHIQKYYSALCEPMQVEYDDIGDNDLDKIAYINRNMNILGYLYAGSRVGLSFERKLSMHTMNIPYYTRGGMNLTNDTYSSALKMQLECIYNLNKVRMQLKMKKWRDNQESLNMEAVTNFLLMAFDSMMRYFDLVGYNHNSIIICYLKKDAINITRLKN